MQKITSIINNQQGSVIIMAVIILALLTVIGISATNTSTTEVQVSTNAVLHNIAFYTADSGIEAGRAALNNIKIGDAGSWDKLLYNQQNPSLLRVDKKKVTWKGTDCIDLNEIIDAEKTYSEEEFISVGLTAFTSGSDDVPEEMMTAVLSCIDKIEVDE